MFLIYIYGNVYAMQSVSAFAMFNMCLARARQMTLWLKMRIAAGKDADMRYIKNSLPSEEILCLKPIFFAVNYVTTFSEQN